MKYSQCLAGRYVTLKEFYLWQSKRRVGRAVTKPTINFLILEMVGCNEVPTHSTLATPFSRITNFLR